MQTLLIALTLIPAILLCCALWESRVAAQTATDIDDSGSLRYRSLYVYEATRAPRSVVVGGGVQYATMREILHDLRRRHPTEVRATDAAWAGFSGSMDHAKTLDWPTTERMRAAADVLTSTLDAGAQAEYRQTSALFGVGIALLALSLPWGFYLTRALRTAEDENAGQTAALARLSNRYAELYQNIPVACFTYDDQGRIADWNRSSETLFGKSATQVIGLPLWEAISRRERWGGARELVAQVLSGESMMGLEWTPETREGESPRTVVTNAFPLRDAQGRTTGGICVNADVTARRQAEAEQKRLMAEVAESERRLSNITSRSHCLLWEAVVTVAPAPADYSGPFWDETAKTILSWDMTVLQEEETFRWLSVARAPGDSFRHSWQQSIPPETIACMKVNTAQALHDGLPRYVHEFPCRLADDTVCWLLENVEISAASEDRFELVGICTDITPQKEAETRLRALAADLERSNGSLQEFAYIASHDLKEPLRKIRTFGGMLSRRAEGALPPDCAGYLERMISATERMQALIDGLLDYSRAARKPRAVAPIDLNEVVRGVLADLEVAVERSGAQVRVGALPTLKADPLQMRQLFQNLIGNALKFHQSGQAPLIEIHTCLPEGTAMDDVQVVVRDRGIGFDAKYAERIFEMFEQLEARGSGKNTGSNGEGGTGVGLAICRKIAERHGGTIRASSDAESGTTFTITLPLLASSEKHP